MTDGPGHPGDELQLLLDDRLAAERRAAVEAHLVTCARCRRELDALRRVKATLREDLPKHPVPPDLAARISGALAAEGSRGSEGQRPARIPRRPLLMGVGLAAAAALAVLLARGRQPDPVEAAAKDFASYRAATLRLDLVTSDPATLERFFAAVQVPFPTRVFDFGMMGYRLAGGRAHRLAGRLSALFAYEGAGGDRLVCQMYEGNVADLAAPVEVREHNDIRFRIYKSGDLTLVFWQEGSVVCVLVAAGDAEAAIQLAYAKAMKV